MKIVTYNLCNVKLHFFRNCRENDFGRSYSFTAFSSKNSTSTHANLMIYGIFSDQLLHSIIDDGSSTKASEEPEDQNE